MKRLLAALFASLLVLAACGGDSGPDPADDPKGALTEGMKALGEGGLTMTLSLNSTPEDLALLAEEDGSALTEEDAQKILDSSFTLSTNNETDPEAQQLEMSVNVAGLDNAVELKMVEQVLYVRASVRDLAEEFGGDVEEIEASLAQAPPGFEFLGPAIEGEWIGLTGFKELAEQMGGGAAATEEQQEQANKFAGELATVLEESSTVEHEGSDDIGEHLVANVNLRQAYEGFTEALGSFGGLASAQLGALPPASEVPDEEIRLDAWVEDGRVVQLQFDLTQFAEFPEAEFPEGVDNLGLRIALDEFDDDIEVPETAEEVDIATLMQGLMGGMMGSDTTGGTATEVPEDFCASLEGAPEEVITQFAQECPELQP